MNKLTSTIFTTFAALGILGGTSGRCLAQGPAGDYYAEGSAPANAVWDLSAIPELNGEFSFEIEDGDSDLDIYVPIALEQTGSGKLAGSDSTVVLIDSDDDDILFTGSYKAKGTVTSRAGLTKARLSVAVNGPAEIEGALRAVKLSHSLSFELDNATLMVTGRSNSKGSANGLDSISSEDSWGPEMADATLGTGAWQLNMGLETMGKKIAGTRDAVVTLESGKQYVFNVKGVYNAKTQLSKIVLSGKDLAKGSNLRITMNSVNEIVAIQGKIAGQFVNLVD